MKKSQVTYKNVISPLAELEAQQFPLVQSCVIPKLVSTSDKVRKASAEAEKKIDAHASSCRFNSLVYDLYQNQDILFIFLVIFHLVGNSLLNNNY